jgi:protein tyrosine phosphatase
VSKNAEYNKAASIAQLPFNFMQKNRYANVLARTCLHPTCLYHSLIAKSLLADETRVKLQSIEGVPGSDYINANYITVRTPSDNRENCYNNRYFANRTSTQESLRTSALKVPLPPRSDRFGE